MAQWRSEVKLDAWENHGYTAAAQYSKQKASAAMCAHRIVIDTDPGIDDALAMLLAVASPELDLRALTVIGGNVPLAQCVTNTLAVLELLDMPTIPVAAGVTQPLIRPVYMGGAVTHGESGLGDAQLPPPSLTPTADHAVDRLISEIMAAPGEVTLIAIGPLTNVALALRKEPRIITAVRQVIFMGGALLVEGNTTPVAEFNVFADPHAAHIVLHSGMPITLLPWDITSNVLMTQADVDGLLQIPSPLTRFVADATRFYIEFHHTYFGTPACSVNDPAAVALAFLPELAKTRPVFVDVEIGSELTMGQTVADYVGMRRREPNVQVVVEFDTPRFMHLMLERLAALARSQPAHQPLG
jgi:purine nucleosidase